MVMHTKTQHLTDNHLKDSSTTWKKAFSVQKCCRYIATNIQDSMTLKNISICEILKDHFIHLIRLYYMD